MAIKVEFAALTDVGCVRTNNEDSFGYDLGRQIYVVCDGMGGMASGEVASQMAVSTFLDVVATNDRSVPVEMTLHQAIMSANDTVYRTGTMPQHKGMGTTLVAACVDDGKLYIGNVGDSRAYMIQNGQCMQLTVDHSYLNELIRTGAVAVEDAGTVDLKGMESVITRAVGVTATIDPDFFAVDLTAGDIVLLASDGLTRYLNASDIGVLVTAGDLNRSCEHLVAIAKERGGADNITVLLLHIADVQSELLPA
ncbi:Stp1/IreP family PP2C-type Ser/Thr phosphatase [Granulicella arctica]|uniref:Stp1/IreP family PP2C-type Ser/Thr phosphatase n=1 Tax=Granulicella arctica TaxID=940613 RepID=UPI0021E047F3|nr:Stp1/IreP family PP2C-type Ser/Thr phosphatase [Granulicella arctica]